MTGAGRRIEREIEALNRQSWNSAALTGGAFGGKLPSYEEAFPGRIRSGGAQSAAGLEASLNALAKAWGAVE